MGRFGRWRALQGEAARTDRQLFDQLARSLCRRHWASKVTARGPPPLLAARRRLCAEGLCDSIVQFGSRGHSAERAATALPGSAGGLTPIEKIDLASRCFEQSLARARYVRRCRVRHAGAGQFSLAQVPPAIHRGASACALRSAAGSQVLALPIIRPRALPCGHWTLTAIASLLRSTPALASVARGRFAGPKAPSARTRAPRRRGAGIGRWRRFAEASERAAARKVFWFHAA